MGDPTPIRVWPRKVQVKWQLDAWHQSLEAFKYEKLLAAFTTTRFSASLHMTEQSRVGMGELQVKGVKKYVYMSKTSQASKGQLHGVSQSRAPKRALQVRPVVYMGQNGLLEPPLPLPAQPILGQHGHAASIRRASGTDQLIDSCQAGHQVWPRRACPEG